MREATDKSVAEFLKEKINASGKMQREIAKEAGFEKPNIITMLKQGKTKLPISRIGALAKAIDADPAHLLRLVMSEYCPETWQAIEDVAQDAVLTANELKLVRAYREATGNSDAAPLVIKRDGVITFQASGPSNEVTPSGCAADQQAVGKESVTAHFLVNDPELGWQELSLKRGLGIFHGQTCVPGFAQCKIRVAFVYCAPVAGGGVRLQRVECSELSFAADGRADEDALMAGILTRIDPAVTTPEPAAVPANPLQSGDVEDIRRCLGVTGD
ncbi:hypothetical protein [Rhodocyclus tenuis]|uniref:hypothetical protein n=1 Tax=Rhodocyclus tenuis TaxID=1066 RepID=UPI001905FFEE|nr:hypothetical protein [Rhodocyclus tenuis]MBK1679922.1 hypothetical protein [Rhodocyclus tenuis]